MDKTNWVGWPCPAPGYEYYLIVAIRDVEMAKQDVAEAEGDLNKMQASHYFGPGDLDWAKCRVELRKTAFRRAEEILVRVQTNPYLRTL